MLVQVHTDPNIQSSVELTAEVEALVTSAVSRVADRVSRVQVHLGDENSRKGGSNDKRCMIEARPAGQQPVAVTHKAATLDEALDGAAEKLGNLLESKFGRLEDRKGAPSIRDGNLP